MATATSITYTTSNCGDIGFTTISVEDIPPDFFVGMEECRRGLTVDLDVALGKKPRFKPWQLTGPLGVLS